MRCIGLSLRRLAGPLTAVGFLALITPGALAGGKLIVAVSIDRSSDLDRPLTEAIRAEIGSAPLRILKAGATKVTVETDQAGYDYLLSADELGSVKLVSGTEEATAEDVALNSYTIRLRTASSGLEAAGRDAPVSVSLLSRQTGGSDAETTGGGTLLVRALDAAGREVARRQVADPRIIRSEAADASGKISGRHDYLSADATLVVSLPALASIQSLSIEVPDGRALARLKIR